MLFIMTIAVFSPFCITSGALFLNYDTTDFLLKEVLLSDPKYWDTTTVYKVIAIRALLLILVFMEVSRSGSYFFVTMLLGSDQCTQNVIAFYRLNFQVFANYYNRLRLLYSEIRNWFEWLMYIMEGIFFWGTVLACWFTIAAYDRVELPIYLGALISTVGFIGAQILILPEAVDGLVKAYKVVEFQRKKVRLVRVLMKRCARLEDETKVSKSILPISVYCGSFRRIDREFLTAHFDLLVNRVFDTILIA